MKLIVALDRPILGINWINGQSSIIEITNEEYLWLSLKYKLHCFIEGYCIIIANSNEEDRILAEYIFLNRKIDKDM